MKHVYVMRTLGDLLWMVGGLVFTAAGFIALLAGATWLVGLVFTP